MAQRVHRDTGAEVQKTSAIRLSQPGAFALHKSQGRTVIGRQNGRDHRIILLR